MNHFRSNFQSRVLVAIAAGIVFSSPPGLVAQEPAAELPNTVVDYLWETDPDLQLPDSIPGLNPAYTSLWMEAIQHPEVDLQQETAVVIERAHREGFADFTKEAGQFRALLSTDNHQALNVALASLLVALDDQESVDQLVALLKPKQIELSQVIEPALAKWDYRPIRDVWRSRLQTPLVRRIHLTLAIEGLMTVRDEESSDRLLEMATDRREKSSIRIAAAKAVGNIRNSGLLDIARQMSRDTSHKGIVDRLCAASFLSRHDSDSSNALLKEFSLDTEPTVAAIAWRRLLQIDSALAVAQADECLENNDPNIRSLVIQSLLEQPTVQRIDQLGVMMDDRHPDVRIKARRVLHHLASISDEFDKRVRIVGMKSAQESPSGDRGVEQALILLAALDHKNVAGLAVELLEDNHPRVTVAAAWALRVLSVEDTLPAMLDRATRTTNAPRTYDDVDAAKLDQLAHLLDGMGKMKYRRSEELMRRFIPKTVEYGADSRPAAIAALGRFYEGKPDEELIVQLLERFHDRESMQPEETAVILSCSVTFGRMKAKQTVPDLKQDYPGGSPKDPYSLTAAWSLREITGQAYPPPSILVLYRTDFNLQPGTGRLKAANSPAP